MKIGLITIGDELLIGQTVNTNATWLGQEFSQLGVSIYKSTTIQDEQEEIIHALNDYMDCVDLIIITGGLGPTKDDITKETLADYFDSKLEMDQETLTHIENFFKERGREMVESNVQQAMLPKDATILKNNNGTAAGMWFKKNEKVVVSLPGVPYEMKALISEEIIPRIQKKFGIQELYHQTLMTQGIGESFLAEQIESWEDRIYKDQLHLAYLPSPGIVKLRLSSDKGHLDHQLIDDYFAELKEMLPQYVYGKNNESIFKVVGSLLQRNNSKVGTIESCTGGGIANAFVQIPGSSNYFQGGFITYTNELKVKYAHVKEDTLHKKGAVSKEVVEEMAIGGRKELEIDFSIAVSGIAGPDGGTEEKPVGTVWIAVASKDKVYSEKFMFGNHRGRNMEKTGLYAANMLRKMIFNLD